MQTLALLARRPDGKTVMHQLVPMEDQIVELPEHMAGPFGFEFSISDSIRAMDFQGRLLVNEVGFVLAFKTFPVMAAVAEELMPTTILERIVEREGHGAELRVLSLEVEKTFQNGSWLIISQQYNGGELLAFLADDKGKTFTLPFYNFYENGTVCTGNVNLGGEVWQRIQAILTSRTTPHTTFKDKHLKFRPKDGFIIKDDGGKVKNAAIDLPEIQTMVTRLTAGKLIGKIQPA